jgi:hypothetical protein
VCCLKNFLERPNDFGRFFNDWQLMTFELSAEHGTVRDKARGVAQMITSKAVEIDRDGRIPGEMLREVRALADGDAIALVVAIEQLAVASPAVALASVSPTQARALTMSGLRGANELDASPRTQLVLAAVALGIGKAAMDAAVEELRQSKATPGADVEKPHWVVADVATEIDAARLLVYKAAGTSTEADIAVARLMASGAAARSVDAAVRVIGPAALVNGSVVERLSRDVRALGVLLGTEEDQRAMAAAGMFPR